MCLPQVLQQKKARECVIYSFGVRTDVSWELEVAAKTACSIWMFDPTVDRPPATHERFFFEKLGLGGTAGDRPVGRVDTLEALMRRHNHTRMDVLKVDIEGMEFEVFAQLEGARFWPFDQLLIEVHYEDVPKTLRLFRALENAGYRVFSRETNYNPCAQNRPPIAVEFGFVRKESPFGHSVYPARIF